MSGSSHFSRVPSHFYFNCLPSHYYCLIKICNMKTKIYLLLFMMMSCGLGIGCKRGHRTGSSNVSLTVEENDSRFSIFADYNPANTKKVESVLDKYLKETNDASFTNTQIDADMTLSNRTVFHIKHICGELKIEVNKDKNPAHTIETFKKMAEELKGVL